MLYRIEKMSRCILASIGNSPVRKKSAGMGAPDALLLEYYQGFRVVCHECHRRETRSGNGVSASVQVDSGDILVRMLVLKDQTGNLLIY